MTIELDRVQRHSLYIRTWDDPVLKTVCRPVPMGTKVKPLIQEMKRLLKESETGVGLAAPQVGVSYRVIYIWPDRGCGIPMINPVITSFGDEKVTLQEGCLSFPGIFKDIMRSERITIDFFDEDWKPCKNFIYAGYTARIIQHEEDHLRAVCQVGEGEVAQFTNSGYAPGPNLRLFQP